MILIADEDRDTRVILRAVLEQQNFAVVDAASGDEAVSAFALATPDLVILNYPMPGGDGRTLVQHLRAQTASHWVPILNLTSRVVPQFLAQAAKDGVDMSVPKPVDVKVLLRIIDDLIDSTRAVPVR